MLQIMSCFAQKSQHLSLPDICWRLKIDESILADGHTDGLRELVLRTHCHPI